MAAPGMARGADLGREIDRRSVEREILTIVGGLVGELGGPPRAGAVTLRDSLDRDLGIGSLERVELLLRLERAFGVRLADDVMVRADTPADLVSAILVAGPAVHEKLRVLPPVLEAGTPAPASARTLVEVLRWHVESNPERAHIFLRQESGDELPISYGALWRGAAAIATGLRARGLRVGETVSLMLRTEEAFFSTFFGILLAGGIPVPIYPPFRLDRVEEYARRQVGILRNAEARLLVTFREAALVAGLLRSRVPSLRAVATPEELSVADSGASFPGLSQDDPALIQYTSGSTGEPKGVLLTNANLLANIRAYGQAIEIRPDDVGVSWLPLYHDMGLIGSWLGTLYFGVPIALMSPLAFLSRPSRWLWSLHAHRGTLSPAPNFAFELCARRIPDGELEGLDLSAWRLAFNGSEAVSPQTIARFTRRFAAHGFRPEAMCPVYGLAESSVALTVPPPGRRPRIDRVVREKFERLREARPASADDSTALQFVCCGRAIPAHQVRVVDRAGRAVAERLEGRVEFRGPSVTSGYYRRPEATRVVLHDGWMDSGDLGYCADGELFITGRQKDIIIKGGRNLYPDEVEEAAGDIPGIRKGCVAAFSVADPSIGTERLVVVAETRETRAEGRDRLRAAVVDGVVEALGIPPDVVVITDPGSVLKTSSGKLRRAATRDAYLRGELGRKRPSVRRQWARLIAQDVAARAGRVARRASEVGFATYVALVLLVALPALWLMLLVAPRGRTADRVVKLWCRGLLRMCGCPVRVQGIENLTGIGPAVLCPNHSSYVDSVALLAVLPPDVRFVAKRELLRTPLIGKAIRKVGHVAVERVDLSRSVSDADTVSATLRGGASLLVFPEGTFVTIPGLLPFRLGAFKAAVEAGRPVVPIAITGTRQILPGDAWLPHWGTIRMTVGHPIEPRGTGWPEMVRLRDAVRGEIARATGDPLIESRPVLA